MQNSEQPKIEEKPNIEPSKVISIANRTKIYKVKNNLKRKKN